MRIDYRELGRMYRGLGPQKTVRMLRESIEAGHVAPEDFSLKRAAMELVCDRHGNCCGSEFIEALDPRQGDGLNLLEAGNAVDTSAFSNISGQIVYSKILDAYNSPEFLWPQLCQTIPTPFDGERIPGVNSLGDVAETVDEGQPYPTAGVSENWIDTPQTVKRGLIVPVTKEAVFFDRTHQVLQRAGEVGHWLGVNKEKRVIDIATGQTNNWKWKGTAYNTYAASGGHGWVNQHTAAFTDWSDVSEAEALFNAMTDPATSEPLTRMATTLIVPLALRAKALYTLHNTGVAIVDNQANAGTVRVSTGNEALLQGTYRMLTGPMIKARTSSDAKWFLGDPQRAFAYMENWSIQTQQAGSNTEADFTSDIVMRFKAGERGVAAVLDPTWMTYSVGSG